MKRILLIMFVHGILFIFASCGSSKMLTQPHDSETSIVFASGRGVSNMIASKTSNEPIVNSDGSDFKASMLTSGINVLYYAIRHFFVHFKNGFFLKLENLDTHEQYDSEFFKSLGRHNNIVFYNIPAGPYKVVEVGFALKVKTGEAQRWDGNIYKEIEYYENLNYYCDSQDLSDFFGTIVIEPGRKYYLGTYRCYGQYDENIGNQTAKMEYLDPYSFINVKDAYIPSEIMKAVSKSDWKEDDFIILRTASESNVFDFGPAFVENDE